MAKENSKPKVSMSWSSGKDAALALYKVLQANELEVVSLHTNLSQGLKRVGMHGTPQVLVEAQAQAIGLPLDVVEVPPASTNEQYEKTMLAYYRQLKAQGVEGIVYGDIFLEDLRTYRDGLLQQAGLNAYYPLWQEPTTDLANQLQQRGVSAIVCAASSAYFGKEALGRFYDNAFLAQLPAGCDPCGERGEFHTYVVNAPFFAHSIQIQLGEREFKRYALAADKTATEGMWFVALLPA